MSNTLLVPIDFSPNSTTAVNFAVTLAKSRNFAIHLYHNYTVASVTFDHELEDAEQIGFKADLLMSELLNTLQTAHPTINFFSTCERGIITESIIKLTKSDVFNCVIMGTKGKTNNTSAVMGSKTFAVTQKSQIPVIAIPTPYANKLIKRVGLLSNFKLEELDTLNEYIKIFGSNIDLEIIHVHQHEESKDDLEAKLEVWKYQIKKHTDITHVDIEVESISNEIEELDSIPEVINDTIIDEKIDVLLITKTRKSFFERLFFKSVSKEIIHHPIVPTFFSKI